MSSLSGKNVHARTFLPLLVLGAVPFALGDIPAHCVLQDVAGQWQFLVGPPVAAPFDDMKASIPQCGHHIPNNVVSMLALNRSSLVSQATENQFSIDLSETISESPERHLRAVTNNGSEGNWTMVFDEGFEVRMQDGRSFFAEFFFEALPDAKEKPSNDDRWTMISKYYGRKQPVLQPEGDLYACHCDQTSTGWWHRPLPNGELESGCFWGYKQSAKTGQDGLPDGGLSRLVSLAQVQKRQRKTASLLEVDAVLEHEDIARKQKYVVFPIGARKETRSAAQIRGHLLEADPTCGKKGVDALPKTFDWRETLKGMPGSDVFSEQFSQGNCGSCYAFSGAMVLQMMFRIRLFQKYNLLYPLELSWKSATQCSPYTEGCDGGFAYLTFKQSFETGLPLADCDQSMKPEDLDNTCNWGCYRNSSLIFYAKQYGQTGGFAHGASEESIMRKIKENGPVIVSFAADAVPEFDDGKAFGQDTTVMTKIDNKGVPQEPSSSSNDILPWRYTTHSILAVGWGEDKTPSGEVVKYWIIRNSHGKDWGDAGYAKFRRGQNDAAIETSAPWVEPDMDRLPPGFLEYVKAHHKNLSSAPTFNNEKPAGTAGQEGKKASLLDLEDGQFLSRRPRNHPASPLECEGESQ
jgi:cathepsin C